MDYSQNYLQATSYPKYPFPYVNFLLWFPVTYPPATVIQNKTIVRTQGNNWQQYPFNFYLTSCIVFEVLGISFSCQFFFNITQLASWSRWQLRHLFTPAKFLVFSRALRRNLLSKLSYSISLTIFQTPSGVTYSTGTITHKWADPVVCDIIHYFS